MEEYPLTISDRICGQLQQKNRLLSDYVKDLQDNGDKQGVVQVRIHQLALSKVLVNVHNRSAFILVQAHTNLGESYLTNKYYQQALDHLTSALKLNGTLFNQIQQTKTFHTHILTLLGKCYMQAGGTDDALGLLQKALKMNQALVGQDNISNAPIYSGLATAYTKKKDYKKSLDCLTTVWELHQATFGMKHQSIPAIYIEMAKIYHKENDLENAIDMQKRALNLMLELEMNSDQAAKVGVDLANWLQTSNNYPQALDALRQAESLYEFSHGLIDKRTSKVKRSICMLLLKAAEYQEALEECVELEELDRNLHGENSLPYAKHLKVIATILMILNRYSKAAEYFNRAIQVFRKHKNTKKTIKEIREKLTTIEQGLREDPEKYNQPEPIKQLEREGSESSEAHSV